MVGRFTSVDPIKDGLNWYAYCYNNPIKYVDPSGKSAECDNIMAINRYDDVDGYYKWLEKYNRFLKYDAIYVTDYTSHGLKIVGHSMLYLKDENGIWYLTEFIGEGFDESTAEVLTYKVTEQTIKRKLEQPLQSFTTVDTNGMTHTSYYDGVQYVGLYGDFSESIKLANDYAINNDYPKYNLIFNNCLHYVKKILRAGLATNNIAEMYIEKSIDIIPRMFGEQLSLYSAI